MRDTAWTSRYDKYDNDLGTVISYFPESLGITLSPMHGERQS